MPRRSEIVFARPCGRPGRFAVMPLIPDIFFDE